MKVFVTKHLFTEGIMEREVEHCVSISPKMVKGTGLFECYFGEGKEWHRTREGAVARAEVMRTKKIASLKKTIAKISAMKF